MDSTTFDQSAKPSSLQPRFDIVFEDYIYYANLQRHEERVRDRPTTTSESGVTEKKKSWFTQDFETVEKIEQAKAHCPPMTSEQLERANASRALRLTSWLSVFCLLTTDILGPFNAPFALSQVGWVPGILLYFFMGVAATYSGLILWQLFMRLDSIRHPVRSYADIAERIFGKGARYLCTILQSVQLLMGLSVLVIGCGQGLSQVVRGRLCFSVCVAIFPVIGMIIGQIRTLNSFSWLSNFAIWINLAIIFISMGFIANSLPNYEAAALSLGVEPGPVVTATFVNLPLYAQMNGVMNMVFAYGGAMIFPEVMAEMRSPMDFWKAFSLAQLIVFAVYLTYGCFVYAYQGQFTLPLAFQGVSKYSWQAVGNAMGLIPTLIVAGLYMNIGIKILYSYLFEKWFKGPQMMSPKGRIDWSILVLAYWSLGFVIGSAIPQIANIIGLVSAVSIMQFTYTFPPLLFFAYEVIVDAMREDRPYIPGNRAQGRVDTWQEWSRWKRGIFSGRWYFKLFNLTLGLGGLVTACLGMWGSGESIKAAFQISGAATSFGCSSPI